MPFGRKRLNWEETALRLAVNIAKYRSEDPYVIVGSAIITKDKRIFLGYNGAPAGVEIDWSDRNARRDRVIHAEANVLTQVSQGDADFIAVTAMPCKECIKLIAQKKIKRVIYLEELAGYDNDLVKKLAKEFGIKLEKVTLNEN